ncbi:hypothetical protein [Rhizobium leguminosarum]
MRAVAALSADAANDFHQRALSSFIKPAWLIKGELTSPKWVVKLGNSPEVTIDFDQQLTPWPDCETLLDPRYAHDLVTLKTLIIHALRPRPLGWIKAASSLIQQVFKPQLVLLRWRIANGISSYSQLNFSWFNLFDKTMKRDARDGLLDLSTRARQVLEAVKEGLVKIESDGRRGHKSTSLARLMGLTDGKELTPASRAVIEAHFASEKVRFSRAAVSRSKPIKIKATFTREATKRYYRAWFDLWRLRDQIDYDPIGFQAFKSLRAINQWVRSWTDVGERTPDAPPYQTSFLINAALSLLLSPICEETIELVKRGVNADGMMRDKEALKSVNRRLGDLGLPRIGPHYQNTQWSERGVSVRTFVFVILGASARVVKAAFTARRDAEIARSTIDCIEEDEGGTLWMNCYINKNVNDVDRIPVPTSVDRAVKILAAIRELGGREGNKLYDFRCPITHRNVELDLSEKLDLVRDFLQVPLLDDGSAWHFTPHQFRKFFGVTYFWRWAFPNLTALTYHYRHFNSDTTRAYIEMKAAEALRMNDEKRAKALRKRDIERQSDLESSRTGFVGWVFETVIQGKLFGPLAKRIKDEIERLKEKFLPEMVITSGPSAGSFDGALAALVDRFRIQTHPEGHSLCGCGDSPEDHKISVCHLARIRANRPLRQGTKGAAFDFADDDGCLSCGHRGQLVDIMSPYWDQEYRHIIKALSEAKPDMVEALMQRAALIQDKAMHQGAS